MSLCYVRGCISSRLHLKCLWAECFCGYCLLVAFIVVCFADNVLWLRNAESVKCWNLLNLLSWLKIESHFNGWEWAHVLHLEIDAGLQVASPCHICTPQPNPQFRRIIYTAVHVLFKTKPHARCCDFSFHSDSLQPSICHSIISDLECKDIPEQSRTEYLLMLVWH